MIDLQDRLQALEQRIAELEFNLEEEKTKTRLLMPAEHVCHCKETDGPILDRLILDDLILDEPAPEFRFSDALIKKPVMYIYNMTGGNQQMTVDLSSIKIADAVPALRKDGKIVFIVDDDSYINGKYSYLYYEIDGTLPKSSIYVFVRNDKNLVADLNKLCTVMSLYGQEAKDFVGYWELELKRSDKPYYKCEIFTEEKLDKLYPIDIDPKPEFMIRRYVKFVEVDKLGKSNFEALTQNFKPRTGGIRVVEWGGLLAKDSKIR